MMEVGLDGMVMEVAASFVDVYMTCNEVVDEV
jgi:hypothetical protein